jgi:transaldolase
MTRLQRLYTEQGQSPWLDNLSRDRLDDGSLQGLIETGIRGVTANPSIFAQAMSGSDAYTAQLSGLLQAGTPLEDAYWELVITDITRAANLFAPLYESTGGGDGFVSVEVSPEISGDTTATIDAAQSLHQRIDRPNLMVKIPATDAGIPAIEGMTASGHSINITLIFSLTRYRQVIDAYMSGLEALLADGGDPTRVHSVASFFVSRVDTEVDRRLAASGSDPADALLGSAAVAQARLAYQTFRDRFTSQRWLRLAGEGANVQRPLWASTSTKNPDYPDTKYVDELVGPDTVTTIADGTIDAFENHGTVARTIDQSTPHAVDTLDRLQRVGIDLDEVGAALETQGIERFRADQQSAIDTLVTMVGELIPVRSTQT